jgi:hypothetical protein
VNELPNHSNHKATELLAIAVVLFGFALLAAVPVQGVIEAGFWLKEGEWRHFAVREFLDSEIATTLTTTSFIGLNDLSTRGLDLWVSVPITALGVLWFVIVSAVWK